ncbi:MAG: AAA family ATPase [Lacrimispora sphenoides]
MRIDKAYIKDFKNLKQFTVDIDEKQLTNVFIGKNGAGKSNLIEALVIIFRDLDFKTMTLDFSYQIQYKCNGYTVQIDNDKENKRQEFVVNGKSLTKSQFYKNWHKSHSFLPEHVFAYYSGPSNRLEKHFAKHQKRFYNALLKGDDQALRPLFYARMIHSHFVLLAFFSFFDENSNDFLKEYLDVESVESILFVLKQPNWCKKKNAHVKSEFWGANGVVRGFLDDLYQYSLAPIKETATFEEGFSNVKREVTYLYLKDQDKLTEFASKYKNNTEFFKFLESTYLSDLIHEIRIKVKKSDGTIITFNELSEGEQQLLSVLGLLKFTKSKESLFLLDEPDTHLNPAWKFNFLTLIKNVVGESDNSQVIISTHDPIVIGGLRKEAVTIFEKCESVTAVRMPEIDPKGMGVAGLLTSELFDLPSTLDPETQEQLNRKRQLTYKKDKSKEESAELKKLEDDLEKMGFSRTTRDPLYEKFIEKLFSRPEYQKKELSDEDLKSMEELTDELLDEILGEEGK